MLLPPTVTLKDVPGSDAVEKDLRRRIGNLERFHGRITGCRVLVEPSPRRHREGNHFRVRIDLTVPGSEIVVRRDPPGRRSREVLALAIREAFDAARRRLEDDLRRRSGYVKAHAPRGRAVVARVFRDRGYGFLVVPGDRRIYFHRNSVKGAPFDELEPGTPVRFTEEEGMDGPQATAVRPLPGRARVLRDAAGSAGR